MILIVHEEEEEVVASYIQAPRGFLGSTFAKRSASG